MKAQSVGFGWIYAIVTLFGLGVLYIVFSNVFSAYLVPTIFNMTNQSTTIDNATKAEVIGNINQYLMYWNALPYVIILCVVIFMIVLALRKEQQDFM